MLVRDENIRINDTVERFCWCNLSRVAPSRRRYALQIGIASNVHEDNDETCSLRRRPKERSNFRARRTTTCWPRFFFKLLLLILLSCECTHTIEESLNSLNLRAPTISESILQLVDSCSLKRLKSAKTQRRRKNRHDLVCSVRPCCTCSFFVFCFVLFLNFLSI